MSELMWSVRAVAVDSPEAALTCSLADPQPGRVLAMERDRRAGISTMERASSALAHAAEYLVREQMEGRGGIAVREAIGLLCEAGERILEGERRADGRRELARWMRGAQAARARIAQSWR